MWQRRTTTGRNSGGSQRYAKATPPTRAGPKYVAGEEPSKWRPLSALEVLIWLVVASVAGAFLMLLSQQAWAAAAVATIVIIAFAWRELRRRG